MARYRFKCQESIRFCFTRVGIDYPRPIQSHLVQYRYGSVLLKTYFFSCNYMPVIQ